MIRREWYGALWAVVDLDGTISDCTKREHYQNAARAEKDPDKRLMLWESFHALSLDDPPHLAEVMLLLSWIASGGKVVYLTGRPERHRGITQTWLSLQGLPTAPLVMRTVDTGRTLDYKREQMEYIKAHILEAGDRVAFVLEDRNDLVAQWRELGYTCLQPRHG